GLDTQPVYAACRERLSPEGLLVTNLLGRNRGFAASAERLRQAFEGRSLVFPSCDSGNAIAFAAAGEPVEVAQVELKERAESLKRETGLNLLPTLTRLQAAGNLEGGRLLL
ncbi:MAG TPA: spermidine synthase, partial [Azospira sp.]|nr:spermidine synthase [Azospira sp.]